MNVLKKYYYYYHYYYYYLIYLFVCFLTMGGGRFFGHPYQSTNMKYTLDVVLLCPLPFHPK